MPIQNAVMAFTFSEGWHPTDINNMLKYLNDYATNLQWIICDMDSTILRDCGFLGRFIHSFCASGRMANSTNSRTIYVHRVEAVKNDSSSGRSNQGRNFMTSYFDNLGGSIEKNVRDHWKLAEVEKASRKMRKRKGFATMSMKDYESNAVSNFHPPFADYRSIENDKFTDGCLDYADGCIISTKLTTLLDKQVATADKPSTTNSTISTGPSKKPILNRNHLVSRKPILGCLDLADNSFRQELTIISYNLVESVDIPSSTNSIISRRPNKKPNIKPKIRSLGSHFITERRLIRRLRVSKWVKAMSV